MVAWVSGAPARSGSVDMGARVDVAVNPVIIKKYPNRRLYDTSASRYVTLSDLVEMVLEGREFVVHTARSGEDVTRVVLMQIIAERESHGPALLPTEFLTELIRLYGDTMQSFVATYLDVCMETFVVNQERMRGQLWSLFERGFPFGPFPMSIQDRSDGDERESRQDPKSAKNPPG